MEYRNLGKSGLKVSTLSFGSWVTFSNQIDDHLAYECMKVAYDAGVNFFDNAEAYAQGQSEVIMGRALNRLGWSRDSYIVSSKVFWGGDLPTQRGLSRKHVYDACHAALDRLQVDYLDLYFCHRPDHTTPIEETVRAMHELVMQGKVRYWGTSEWSADQIRCAYGIAREMHLTPPTMEQPQYNMLHRERVESEYRNLYEDIGLGTTIWSPLASGLLTNKYANGIPDASRVTLQGFEWLKELFESEDGRQKIEKAKSLNAVADSLGVPLPQLAIAWCAKNPNVSTVILGASKTQQLVDNLKSLDLIQKLTEGVTQEIESILNNRPDEPQRF